MNITKIISDVEHIILHRLELFFMILAEADTPESWGECEVLEKD